MPKMASTLLVYLCILQCTNYFQKKIIKSAFTAGFDSGEGEES